MQCSPYNEPYCPCSNPNWVCATGAQICQANGTSPSGTGCPNGAQQCVLPAPGNMCGATGDLACKTTGWGCVPKGQSPIVIDTADQGYHLTGVDGGVIFALDPNAPVRTSWTDSAYANGWLALDRNGNGTIDDGTELFGDNTPQPKSDDPNGFRALAVFDDPANGGNGNGVIDVGDAVYSHLRVWIDANQDGVSQPKELHTLQELGILKIGLKYHTTPFVDRYGNRLRYKGTVWDDAGHGKDACYDVFLQTQAN